MRIALYSPYLPKHRGGGEKYLMDVAATLLEQGHTVVLGLTQTEPITLDQIRTFRKRYSEFIGRSLAGLELILCPLNTSASWWSKLLWTAQFDVLYYQTDGSLFFSLARKNILHIQIPFTAPKTSLMDRLKLAHWTIKNTNSQFTRQVVEGAWQTKIQFVHYPMIEMVSPILTLAQLKTLKQPVILHVGRFFRQLHCKRQDILVQAFRDLTTKYPQLTKDWQLVCIGSIEDQSYADEVHKMAVGLPVKFLHTVDRNELNEWYKRASIYWHATGYGLDEAQVPEKMEHFGISTVEAMSAGAAPVVINKGGQPEILTDELQAWLWADLTDLVKKTALLLKEPKLLGQVQQAAQIRAEAFGPTQFSDTLRAMIE